MRVCGRVVVAVAVVVALACSGSAYAETGKEVEHATCVADGTCEKGNGEVARPSSHDVVDPSSHPDGLMRAMWMTPLFEVKLVNVISSTVNRAITNRALAMHASFEDGRDATAVVRTDAFYQWQRAREQAEEEEDMTVLKTAFLRSCAQYGAALGWDMERAAKEWTLDNVQAWFGVMESGDYHPAHVHKDALLSGTYYVNVPEGAGDIVFRDPRGPLPPFEHTFPHTPVAGDMVIFPSWLVHEVLPSSMQAGQYRIAVSFNLHGSWEATSDVSVSFPA